jgi:nucleoside-diphosphate-sugar epimerase
MKTALVLGITGGFGGHVAAALAADGWRIRALVRDPARVSPRWQAAELLTGDAANFDDVARAAEGVALIVYGVNAPYPEWDGTVLPWLDVTAQVAEARRLTVVFPGTVYNYDPADGPLFDERAPMRPVSHKGELRQAMEARLKLASERGARVLILRCGNFIGAHTPGSWLAHLLKPTRRGYVLSTAGPRGLRHAWAYLPDLAQTIVALLAQAATLPAFSVFHFRGYEASFEDIAATVAAATGVRVRFKRFPWWALRLASPVSPWFRSLVEMRYLWQADIRLDESRLARALGGAVAHTSLADAMTAAGLIARARRVPSPGAGHARAHS